MAPASDFPATAKAGETIRIIVADDHPIVRSGIRQELMRNPGFEILAEAGDGDQTWQLLQHFRPDVLCLDLNMPGLSAISIVRDARSLPYAPGILILSAYGDSEYVLAFLKAGASAYLLKGEDPTLMAQAVRAVARGEMWFSPGVSATLLRHTVLEPVQSTLDTLSVRELEILRLIARGQDNPSIASHLGVSEGTVKNHVTHLYDKLGVRSRAEAVVWAWEHHIVASSRPPQA